MKHTAMLSLLLCAAAPLAAKTIPLDQSGITAGPVHLDRGSTGLVVSWDDTDKHHWHITFSMETDKPLISSLKVDQQVILEEARPVYRCSTGKRSGGWDNFFDQPPLSIEGTRQFRGVLSPGAATAKTVGDRVEIAFSGMQCGSFSGALKYIFYPGSALFQQVALMSTSDKDCAYIYDAGLEMRTNQQPGGTTKSQIAFFDPSGTLSQISPPEYASQRELVKVKYRTIAAAMGAGGIAAFPTPHRYFFARDYTSNLPSTWYSSWSGWVGIGITQLPDDNTPHYPWINAPPGTLQEMGVFFLVGPGDLPTTLEEMKAYTHADRFAKLAGYITFSPHWHEAFTVEAAAQSPGWVPSFTRVMKSLGLDAAMIYDFHGDGHPQATTEIRLQELKSYYTLCREQSGKDFLLIPGEEANVILGGHWAIAFPHPVYWYMNRSGSDPLTAKEPGYGTVWRVHTSAEILEMVRAEDGWIYETHPRTKGSSGYPDKIVGESFFKDPRYFGVGWKQMPSDLSDPRLGERSFKTVDDLNNLGLHKRLIGEVDVFQLAMTDELYAHMNVNYIQTDSLPSFDTYGELLHRAAAGAGFISTGEVLLPHVAIAGGPDGTIRVEANVEWTFPLQLAELTWGDGKDIHREAIPLERTRQFGKEAYSWNFAAAGWKWARLSVWDIAGDGAFTNPVWK